MVQWRGQLDAMGETDLGSGPLTFSRDNKVERSDNQQRE